MSVLPRSFLVTFLHITALSCVASFIALIAARFAPRTSAARLARLSTAERRFIAARPVHCPLRQTPCPIIVSLDSSLPHPPRPSFQRLVSCASHIESRVGGALGLPAGRFLVCSARADTSSARQLAPAVTPTQRLVILYRFESRGEGDGRGGL